MTSPMLLLLAPLIAVSFGYEPSSDSDTGYDYTVQVEPELLEQMQRGGAESIEANIPPEVTPIRRIRIVVGREPLPKQLRPSAARRTAYRQDVDAASPAIDLLAQTGPAGGFGRNATGFNGAATRASSPPSNTSTTTTTLPPANPTTVPSVGTQYGTMANDLQRKLDAGFQAAGNAITTADASIRDSMNNVGASGQQAIDDTRRYLSDVIAPPANTDLNLPSATPNSNTGFASSQPRGNSTSGGAFDSNRYGASSNFDTTMPPGAEASSTQRWASNDSDHFGASERSVLTNPQTPVTPENASGLTPAERALLDRIERDRQEQQQRAARTAEREAAGRSSVFPRQPQMQSLPSRSQDNVVVSLGNRPNMTGDVVPPAMGPQTDTTGGPMLNPPQSSDDTWQFTQARNQQSPPASAQEIPQITTAAQKAPAQNAQNDEVASWLDGQRSDEQRSQEQNGGSSSTPVWLLGWTIAVGSVATNLFQWLNIVDMRNKYRVALRRNSPNFSRSMAA